MILKQGVIAVLILSFIAGLFWVASLNTKVNLIDPKNAHKTLNEITKNAKDAIDDKVDEVSSKLESINSPPLGVFSQQLAQSSCTALYPKEGFVFAIPRDHRMGLTCAQTCNNRAEDQAGGLSCFNSLHVYRNQPSDVAGAIGLKTYKYNRCDGGNGPNFCCCTGSK